MDCQTKHAGSISNVTPTINEWNNESKHPIIISNNGFEDCCPRRTHCQIQTTLLHWRSKALGESLVEMGSGVFGV
jgi:hypothetical protein